MCTRYSLPTRKYSKEKSYVRGEVRLLHKKITAMMVLMRESIILPHNNLKKTSFSTNIKTGDDCQYVERAGAGIHPQPSDPSEHSRMPIYTSLCVQKSQLFKFETALLVNHAWVKLQLLQIETTARQFPCAKDTIIPHESNKNGLHSKCKSPREDVHVERSGRGGA